MKKLTLIYLILSIFCLNAMELKQEAQETRATIDIANEFINNLYRYTNVSELMSIFESLPMNAKSYIKALVNSNIDPVGSKLIHHAKTALDVDKLMALGADPMAKDKEGEMPLAYMIKYGHDQAALRILRYIPELKPHDLVYPQHNPQVDLIYYVLKNKNAPALLKLLKDKGISDRENIKFLYPRNMVIEAIDINPKTLPYIISMDYDINSKLRPYDNTPLMDAIFKKKPLETIKILIDNGAQVNATNNSGLTPLMLATAFYPKAIGLLINAQADPKKRSYSNQTALTIAINGNLTKAIETLINYGVKPESTDIVFAIEENPEIVPFLIEKNIDIINTKDERGFTPLILAIIKNNNELIKYLISAGADVNSRTKDNMTALMYAVKNNNLEAINLLIQHGAKIDSTDKDHRTALIYAALNNNSEAMSLLIRNNANIEIKDKYDKNANDYYLEALSKSYS